jgi:hypothetical protein
MLQRWDVMMEMGVEMSSDPLRLPGRAKRDERVVVCRKNMSRFLVPWSKQRWKQRGVWQGISIAFSENHFFCTLGIEFTK